MSSYLTGSDCSGATPPGSAPPPRRRPPMKPQTLVVTPESYPQPLNVVGELVTVLASGDATAGYEIFLQEGPEGSGPPPHSHPWDESFFVTRGTVDQDSCILAAMVLRIFVSRS